MVLTLQSEDFLVGVHDGRVGSDRPTDDIVSLGQVDDDDLVLSPDLLPDANEAVALER